MKDINSNTPDSERSHVFAWLLFPLALFPLAALLTYDWRAIPMLNDPPVRTSNWIGALGDYFAYFGYQIFGLAMWIVPVLCVIAALCVVAGRHMRFGRRELWFLCFLSAVASLIQALDAHGGTVANIAQRLNIADAGGAVGYLIMTRFLSPLIGDFGSAMLMAIVLLVTFVAAVGVRNLSAFFSAILRWGLAGSGRIKSPRDDDARQDASAAEDDGADDEQARYLALLRAKEEAKRLRDEEKAAAKAEKQRLRDEKLAAKEAARAAKEAERQAVEAAKARLRAGDTPAPDPRTPAPPVAARPPSQTPTQTQEPEGAAPEDKGPYILPSLALLDPLKPSSADHSNVDELSHKLIDTLKLFGVNAELAYTVQGPVVTKYALTPEPGTRPEKFTSLQSTLMMALKAKSLRIEAPIPGEDKIGIEVPNLKPAGISFREIFESEAWRKSKAELPLLFGKDAAGRELVADLASMPHMLVAGATGQGKSVCLNSLINGLLMTRTPEQLKLIMVDPKSVEFTPYAAIPHLLVPVITDNRKVVFSLHWAVAEMEKRLKLFARARVRNIYDFNHRKTFTQPDMFGDEQTVGSDMPRTVPYIVIIIDEVADLMSQCAKEVTPDIARLTAKARAAGIHLILATQRPDAKVITGTIKANIPGRVAFKTAQAIDSRTILDEAGAENLIGRGDMLFKGKDGLLIRAQGAWISDAEIARVTEFIEQHSNVQFDDKFAKNLGRVKEAAIEDPFAALDEEKDPDAAKAEAAEAREQVKAEENASDFKKAVECIINTNRASTSHFQRKLGWGYNHSAKIMDMLEDAGIIGPQSGAGPRQIIMDQAQLLAVFNGSAANGSDPLAPPAAPADGDDDLSQESEYVDTEQEEA